MFSKFVLVALSLASSNAASDSSGSTKDDNYCDKFSETQVQELHKHAPEIGTCGSLQDTFNEFGCCGKSPKRMTNEMLIPINEHKGRMKGDANPCAGQKPIEHYQFNNTDCFLENGVLNALEQSGINVTKGYQGSIAKASGQEPLRGDYFTHHLCPVNVHWHLGTEHLSMGEYDEDGKGPGHHVCGVDDENIRRLRESMNHPRRHGEEYRRLASEARRGFQCHYYDENDPIYTTEYKWQHCMDMHVGETYEVHWPHSALGACMTPDQYQTPFYDGVFCNADNDTIQGILAGQVPVPQYVGVQAQIFTVVNDDKYYYPDLFRGMIKDGTWGKDMASYTGSTTGTTRSNKICSGYTPITWQVDRQCHLISASSFDKMCADMRSQKDDMTGDMFPHGARELVIDELAAPNHEL